MNADIVVLNDRALPSDSRAVTLVAAPRLAELIVFGDDYFEVMNVLHKFDAVNGQSVTVFVRPTKPPYLEPKERFGFGSR